MISHAAIENARDEHSVRAGRRRGDGRQRRFHHRVLGRRGRRLLHQDGIRGPQQRYQLAGDAVRGYAAVWRWEGQEDRRLGFAAELQAYHGHEGIIWKRKKTPYQNLSEKIMQFELYYFFFLHKCYSFNAPLNIQDKIEKFKFSHYHHFF